MTQTAMVPQETPTAAVSAELRERTFAAATARLATRTRKNYRSAWQRFLSWCEDRDVSYLPASALTTAAYLEHRAETMTGPALGTVKAAIAFMHNASLEPNPCDTELVRSTLTSLRKAKVAAGEAQQIAAPLTAEDLDAIEQTACQPRHGRGRNMETPEYARRRGHSEIALVRTLRDGALRGAEASALEWRDLDFQPDGTGRLIIRKSKTDQLGKGKVRFLTKRTVAALQTLRRERLEQVDYARLMRREREGKSAETCGPRDKVFRLSVSAVYRTVQRVTAAAGLHGRYTAHSGRVGLAVELSRRNVPTHKIQAAGGWENENMVKRYTRAEEVARGAVAEFLDE